MEGTANRKEKANLRWVLKNMKVLIWVLKEKLCWLWI